MSCKPLPLALLVSVLTTGCTNDPPNSTPDCASAELAGTYGAALTWSSSVGEAGNVDGAMPSMLSDVSSTEAGKCALAGVRQGLHKGRCKRPDHGNGQCKKDGEVAGEVAANLYCDLSIALGGLGVDDLLYPGPEDACSRGFEHECGEHFDRIAKSRPDCAEYISGPFQKAYQVARFNQCLFSVSDTPPDPHCKDGLCECRDEADCAMTCQGEGCDMKCSRTQSCTTECGQGCDLRCKDLGTCDAVAGADADLVCERASQCTLAPEGGKVSCRNVGSCDVSIATSGKVSCERTKHCTVDCPDCDVRCRDTGSCDVKLGKGKVVCERARHCNVTCEDGQNPKHCGRGRFVCGGSCR